MRLISHPGQIPLSISNKMVGYILELPAKPVTVVDAASKAAGKGPLTMTQRSSLIGQIKAAQAPVAAAVRAIGGIVTSRFQTVYNGIGIRIRARDAYKLAQLQGVSSIHAMHYYKPANVNSVPVINGPETWDGVNGFTGTGMKIGDIDTGLDYTHADFGGPGTTDEWNYAFANSTVDPTNNTDYCSTTWGGDTVPCFGSEAPKVKGGTDLVGNCYDAAQGTPYNANGIDCTGADQVDPQPDPNPLDCNSHGTHTAGTLAGFGVLGNGSTYDESYDANTINSNSWTVGPGVAPNASLYAIRVFGCSGSVDDGVLMEAMDWAVNNHMDVINMSLGADFGSASDADSVAASNTAKDGVIVVSASGNAGSAPYITSSPAAGTNGIAVAANDSNASFPAASLALTNADSSSGPTLTAIDANGFDISSVAGTYNLHVVQPTGDTIFVNGVAAGTDNGTISDGCSVAADEAGNGGSQWAPGSILVVKRGVCARVAKAIYAQAAGASGVIMVNTSPGYPPFEGTITTNPDTGEWHQNVTIPFLGALSSDLSSLVAADGGTVDLEPTEDIANPSYLDLASFSSWGPSAGTFLKPEITAPGVSVDSAGMGTGNQALYDSGTSMATPHVAGEAALVKQAHPNWNLVQYYKDAILNTANPINVGSTDGTADGSGWSLRGAGAGEADAYNATHTQVVAGGFPTGMSSLNFNAPAMKTDYSRTEYIRLHNFGSSAATFNLADDGDYSTGNDHTVSFSQFGSTISSVTIPAHGSASVGVTLSIPLDSAVDSLDQWLNWAYDGSFQDMGGMITLTPASGDDNSGIGLTVPYYVVPTSASAVKTRINTTQLQKNGTANALVSNKSGGVFGIADWFAWGGSSPVSSTDIGAADLTSAGVTSLTGEEFGIFGLKVTKPWTNPAEQYFEVDIDVDGDGYPDYALIAADYGTFTSGIADGYDEVFVYDFSSHALYDTGYEPLAGFNSTTMEIPFDWIDLCITTCIDPSTPISYVVYSSDRNGGSDSIGSEGDGGQFTSSADPFNLFSPPFSDASNYEDFVPAGTSTTDSTTVDPAQWGATPQEGFLVLMPNNRGAHNADESTTIPFSLGEVNRHHG